MTNSNFDSDQRKNNYRTDNYNNRSNSRNKFGGNRDNGGFRIRLSDNEMKSVKAIQEEFKLKSTVSVLGFSVRTLSELIKDENIKVKITELTLKNNKNNSPFRSEKVQIDSPNPFARPTKNPKIEKGEINNIKLNGDEN